MTDHFKKKLVNYCLQIFEYDFEFGYSFLHVIGYFAYPYHKQFILSHSHELNMTP